MKIRNQKDLAAVVLYVLAGAGFSLGALNYKIGDASRMGPGWFPFAVGLLLAAVGLIVILGSLRANAAPELLKRPELGPMAWVLGGVVLFGLLLQPVGLIGSLVVLVLVSSRASHEFRWTAAIVNAAVLTLFSVGVFIYGINLQIPLWPSFIG